MIPWPAHKYQKDAKKFLLARGAAELFLDPGLGKTAVALAAFKKLRDQGVARRALVIAPLRPCYTVWPEEVKKWKEFSDLKVVVLHGSDKNAKLREPADIYVINPDGLEWLLNAKEETGSTFGEVRAKKNRRWQVDLNRIRNLEVDTLIIDELSKFKRVSTKRFKIARPMFALFARRWGLTGSPAANGLLDLFGQALAIDGGAAFGPYFTNYRSKYFTPVDRNGWKWALRAGADQEIYTKLKPYALRMSAEEYLKLPSLVLNRIDVELPEKARKIYDQLESEFFAVIGDTLILTPSSMSAAAKCRQVASGGIYVGQDFDQQIAKKWQWIGKRGWYSVHDEKLDALEDLLDELQGKPLLVAYEFEHESVKIRERWPDAGVLSGGITMKESQRTIAAWNAGDLPVLAVQPQAGALGLNLQAGGNHLCWYSLTWDFELYDQLIRRLWRQGATAACVFVHHLIAKDTFDAGILGALTSKKRRQDALFTALNVRRRGSR